MRETTLVERLKLLDELRSKVSIFDMDILRAILKDLDTTEDLLKKSANDLDNSCYCTSPNASKNIHKYFGTT